MDRIVVCDDEAYARRVLQVKLEAAGFEVLLAIDGLAGLDLVRSAAPRFLVTDLVMPKMNGLELCEALQAEGRLPALRVLVVTSSNDRAQRARLAALPGVAVVDKPFSPSQVCAWVRAPLQPEVQG
jgi:two-component system alkaline phosphatase synthesis response regulator PhoP